MSKALIFDLDGTLVDTLEDITFCMNAVLSNLGFPSHSAKEYRAWVGWGSRELCRLSLPEESRTEDRIRTVDADLKKVYAADPVARSRPYPGIPEALQSLADRGVRLSVLSNKPDDITRLVLERLFPTIRFFRAFGARDGVPHKPDPAAALAIARDLAQAPGDCLFVGDSDVDMETAVRAGMVPIAVSWGYRDVGKLRAAGAARVLDKPSDLPALAGVDGPNARLS